MQPSLLETKRTDWQPPKELPRLWDAKNLAVDVETKDPELLKTGPSWIRNQGQVVGIGFSDGDKKWYFPMRHDGGGNLDPEVIHEWAGDVLRSPSTKIFFNAQYDLGWCEAEGWEVNGPIEDPSICVALLDELRYEYNLDSCCRDYIGMGKNDAGMEDWCRDNGLSLKDGVGPHIHKMPANIAGFYGQEDPYITFKLWEETSKQILEEDLEAIYSLECRIPRILLKMQQRGVRIDEDRVSQLKDELFGAILSCQEEMKSKFNAKIKSKSNNQIAEMCRKLNIPFMKTEKGNPSFPAPFIDNHSHPFIQLISKMRKAETMYSLLRGIVFEYAYNGRIHALFHALKSDDGGTVSGRFSSSHPNLQQIPKRDPIWGPKFRRLFIAEDGCDFGRFDESQQEYRLFVHFAACINATGSWKAVQAYRDNPNTDYHQ
jgi:DNA polymerase-1